MINCGDFLWRMPDLPVGEVVFCPSGCDRAWELRERTRWLTYAFWLRRAPGAFDDRIWVRLSESRTQAELIKRERDG